ncbi:hypothetical protein [Streptomyces sp. NPDC002889]|uniref:hypothetical protein n=1 Tax=Streptomyces sp. NPDC002889 TaxID=3364669 RepID=UPI0036CDDB3D
MALVVTVQADSREECVRHLQRACALLGLEPVMRPVRSTGTDRWMARATPTAPAAEGQGRGA